MAHSPDKYRRMAKQLKKAFAAGDPKALARVRAVLPNAHDIKHAEALHVVAREDGHDSWPKLKAALELTAMSRAERADRLKMAVFHGHHRMVDRLLSENPDLADANFGLQVALLRIPQVEVALAQDPRFALQPVAGPRMPILHLACSQHWSQLPDGAARSVQMAELLLSYGADVNSGYPAETGSSHQLSALYSALCHAGNFDLGKWLLEHGANPDDNESLYHATELADAASLRLLLDHGANPEGTNALLRALDFDNLEMVTLLLEAGADPNEGVADHPGTDIPATVIPGLHQAARRMCSAPVAEELVKAGANGRARYRGHSAYAIARIYGNRAVASVLERNGQATDLDSIEAHLADAADGPVEGALDPNILTNETRVLIHRLLGQSGRLSHIRRLVGIGLDPNEVDEQEMPALHIAAWEGLSDEVAFLLQLSPDLHRKNAFGGDVMGTVIHGAEYCPARHNRNHMTCAKLLLEAGAVLHMHDVVYSGVEDLAQMLREWADEHPERVVSDA